MLGTSAIGGWLTECRCMVLVQDLELGGESRSVYVYAAANYLLTPVATQVYRIQPGDEVYTRTDCPVLRTPRILRNRFHKKKSAIVLRIQADRGRPCKLRDQLAGNLMRRYAPSYL